MVMAGDQNDGGGPPYHRWRYGLWAVLGGFAAILIAFGIAVFRFGTAADAVAVSAPVIGAIGTLAAAYFGVQAGSAAREDESRRRRRTANQNDT